MDVRLSSLGEIPLLELDGEIDHSTCGVVETALNDILDGGCTVVLLDLRQVAYLDSGGICVLLSAARRLRGNGWLGLISPNENVSRLLEIVGLLADPAVRAFSSRAEAETALRQETQA